MATRAKDTNTRKGRSKSVSPSSDIQNSESVYVMKSDEDGNIIDDIEPAVFVADSENEPESEEEKPEVTVDRSEERKNLREDLRSIRENGRNERLSARAERRKAQAEWWQQAKKDLGDTMRSDMREFVGGLTGKDYNGEDKTPLLSEIDAKNESRRQSENASKANPELKSAQIAAGKAGEPIPQSETDATIPQSDVASTIQAGNYAKIAEKAVENNADSAIDEAVKSDVDNTTPALETESTSETKDKEENAEAQEIIDESAVEIPSTDTSSTENNVDNSTGMPIIQDMDKEGILSRYDKMVEEDTNAYDSFFNQYNDYLNQRKKDEERENRANKSYSMLVGLGDLTEKVINLGGTLAGGVSNPDNGVADSLVSRYDRIREAHKKAVDDIAQKMFQLNSDRYGIRSKYAKGRNELEESINESNRKNAYENYKNLLEARRNVSAINKDDAMSNYYNGDGRQPAKKEWKPDNPITVLTNLRDSILKGLGFKSLDELSSRIADLEKNESDGTITKDEKDNLELMRESKIEYESLSRQILKGNKTDGTTTSEVPSGTGSGKVPPKNGKGNGEGNGEEDGSGA